MDIMNIRDVFAVHAMSALITSPKVNKEDGQMTDADYAALAYIVADAMLRQREVQPQAPAGFKSEDEPA